MPTGGKGGEKTWQLLMMTKVRHEKMLYVTLQLYGNKGHIFFPFVFIFKMVFDVYIYVCERRDYRKEMSNLFPNHFLKVCRNRISS